MHTPRLAIQVSSIMNAPEEAFDKTVAYVRICGGMLVIVAYNLIGCIFRGIGDSRTPLFTVAVACVFNIAGDLILCAGFKMGTSGAAFATVFAQVISVIVSFGVIRKKELPFEMHKTDIGGPWPDSPENGGAVSFAIGVGMFFLSFFHGNVLAGIFSSDAMVIEAAADYLKAYAIDCLFTAIFFCYIGFYNGIGMTKFVMIQGIIGAFCVRVPVSWFMSRRAGATLFDIGLATPFSSILQLVLCLGCMLYLRKKKWV